MKNTTAAALLEAVLDLISGQGKTRILYALRDHPASFRELKQRIEVIDDPLLIRQLKVLEAGGLVHQQVLRQVQPRVVYGVTPLGASLVEALVPLCTWAERYERAGR